MTHRSRFEATMKHERCDRPPIDCIAEGQVPERLVRHLGASSYNGALDRLDIDFRHLMHRDFRAPFEKDERGFFTDMWGVRRRPVVNAYGTYDEVEAYPWPSPDLFDFSDIESRCERPMARSMCSGLATTMEPRTDPS